MSVAFDVGEFMGGFIEYDDSHPLGLEEEMHIKVMLDIGKPLRRGIKLSTGANSSKWVGIKYERLEDFCFFCGRIDHVERECKFPAVKKNGDDEMVYGPYLRGSQKKRGKISGAQREKERILMNKFKGGVILEGRVMMTLLR